MPIKDSQVGVHDLDSIYSYPRYHSDVASALHDAVNASFWDDWDLDGLHFDLPHSYANKMGSKHGIFCSTGTAGLHASLMSLELLPGDEVIVPVMTFIRAVTPLVHLGLQPVLADIDPVTGNIDPDSLKMNITSKTRAVIVVHMWGVPCDIDSILDICNRYGILVIEDFSHAHYSRHARGHVGSFGNVSFASMQRKKTLSVGEGGIIVTNDSGIYERLQAITSPGSFKDTMNYQDFSGYGLNMRMSPFSQIVAKALLPKIDEIISSRAAHVEEFNRLLIDTRGLILPPHIPSFVEFVSPYGYKPTIHPDISVQVLKDLKKLGRWRFEDFNYDHIAYSSFWNKSRAHYPFNLGIKPRSAENFPGYEDYMLGRVGLAIPTVKYDYWTDDMRSLWIGDIKKATGIY